MQLKNFFHTDPAWFFFLIFAFCSMLSLPLARASMLLSLVFALISPKGRSNFHLTSPTLGWLSYFILAFIVSAIMACSNVDPDIIPKKGFSKLDKLLWFIAIPLSSSVITSRERFNTTLKAIVLGAFFLALSILVLNPLIAWLQVYYPTPSKVASGAISGLPAFLHSGASAIHLDASLHEWLSNPSAWRAAVWEGRPPTFFYAITSVGTMHDAQRLMVALIASISLLISRSHDKSPSTPSTVSREFPLNLLPLVYCKFLPFLLIIALIFTCKRGPLLIAIAISFLLYALQGHHFRAILLTLLVAALTLSLPAARTRLSALPSEFDVNKGGRTLMWTQIVPKLHAEHPFGIGFRALTPQKMQKLDPRVEPNRTHVHSTPLEAFVDFGFAGLFVWGFWMVLNFASSIKFLRSNSSWKTSTVPFAAFSALFLFGLIEYNIADAAVIGPYSIMLGLSAPAFSRKQ